MMIKKEKKKNPLAKGILGRKGFIFSYNFPRHRRKSRRGLKQRPQRNAAYGLA